MQKKILSNDKIIGPKPSIGTSENKKSLKKEKGPKKRYIFKTLLVKLLSKYSPLKTKKSLKKKSSEKSDLGTSGVLRIYVKKRNVFCNLSDALGKILFSTSSGCLKVKGKRRIAMHVLNSTVKLIIQGIFKSPIRQFAFYLKAKGPRKKKITLLKSLGKVKAFHFKSLHYPNPRSHNGCRPSKARRK